MAQVKGWVEQLGQLAVGQPLTNLRALPHGRPEVRTPIERAERRPLHQPVRVLPRHPLLHERQQHPLGEHHATAAVEVGLHTFPIDGQAFDYLGHQLQHVVHECAGVREDDPLRRGVADVALVPERLILERGLRIAAHDARQAADPLAEDGIPLVRHRRGAFLFLAEWLAHLRDLTPLQVPDVGGELFQAAGQDGERRQVGRVTVASDHLSGDRRHLQAQFLQGPLLDPWLDRGVGADGAGELANPDLLARGDQPLAVTVELVEPAGQDEAEADRLRMDAVGPARHQRAPLLDRPAPDDRRQPVDIFKKDVGRLHQLQRERRVQHIR